jgi:hypothetical protein
VITGELSKTHSLGADTSYQRISDFAQGDKIDLSAIDASRSGGRADLLDNDAFSGISFGTGAAATRQLRYHHEKIGGTDYTVIQGNVDKDGAFEVEVQLVGKFTLSNSDFIL